MNMDMAQRVQTKLEKILIRLKVLKIIHHYELKINFCDIEDNMKGNLKIVDSILKKCLKRIISKPKRAEIRNVITELVRKKNLNYVSDRAIEDTADSEPENPAEYETSQPPFSSTDRKTVIKETVKRGTKEVPKEYLCERCGKTFRNTWKWKSHEETHSSTRFFTIEDLDRHRLDHQPKDHRPPDCSPAKVTQSTQSTLKSSGCNIKSVVGGKCEEELKSQPKVTDTKTEKNGKSPHSYTCQCGKIFKLRKSLKKHEKLKHVETKAEFRCSYCQRSYYEKSKLNRHLLSHVTTSHHKCSQCSKQFARSDALKRHVMAAHDQIKNFACSFCNKTFTLKYNKDVHEENVHKTRNNWLQCEHCGQKFKTKITLKSHMEIHSGKPISCSLCNKVFVKKINYKNHMKKRHFGVSPYQNLLDSVSREEMISES